MKTRIRFLAFCVIFSLAGPRAFSAGAGSGLDQFDYPELMVTPRASDRLAMEAAKEARRSLTMHLPVQVSALSTLVTAIAQQGTPNPKNDPDNTTWIAGLAVGGGWLAMTGALAFLYDPYKAAQKEINALPKGTLREQLTRERLAEEAIAYQARVAGTLTWLSFFSNLGASTFMVANSQPGEFSRTMGLVAMLASASPLVFRYHWERVHDEQEKYKKKIYAPIAGLMFVPDGPRGGLAPGFGVTLRF